MKIDFEILSFDCVLYLTLLHSESFGCAECNRVNPIALSKAKIAYNFGLSECSWVKVNGYTFRESITIKF